MKVRAAGRQRRCIALGLRLGIRHGGRGRSGLGILDIGDERLFEIRAALGGNDVLRCVADEDATCVHQ